jgi:hypothetical protein
MPRLYAAEHMRDALLGIRHLAFDSTIVLVGYLAADADDRLPVRALCGDLISPEWVQNIHSMVKPDMPICVLCAQTKHDLFDNAGKRGKRP